MNALRAAGFVALGAGASIALTAIWSLLFAANLRSSPGAPWSVLAMALVLVAAWRALAARRPELLPRRCHSIAHRRRALLAALALMSAAFGATLLVIRLAQVPTAALPHAAMANPLLACVWLAMASLVAGVAEEVGFRGVMQHGLERVMSRAVAIVVVAIAFALLHVGNPEFGAFAPIYLASSLGLSLIVRASGSLWPAIAAHALADFASYALLLLAGEDAIRNLSAVAQGGVAAACVAALAGARLAMSRLRSLPRL